MPQLDIYTFPTQIYTVALIFLFGLLYVVKFIFTAFLKIELLEKEEIYTLDTVFLIQTQGYTQMLSSAGTTNIPSVLVVLASSLVHPKVIG